MPVVEEVGVLKVAHFVLVLALELVNDLEGGLPLLCDRLPDRSLEDLESVLQRFFPNVRHLARAVDVHAEFVPLRPLWLRRFLLLSSFLAGAVLLLTRSPGGGWSRHIRCLRGLWCLWGW